MGMLILETIGPRGEELAEKAADATGAAVGIDPEFNAATFDSDDLENDALEAAGVGALDGIDPDGPSHLRVAR